MKMGIKIHRASLVEDWERFLLVVEKLQLEESEAVSWLPLLLEDSLLRIFKQATQSQHVQKFNEAKQILMELVGLEKTNYDDFSTRRYKIGEETLRSFFYDLQGMSITLNIPEGMVKSQFLNGLPQEVASKVRPFINADSKIEDIVAVAEKVNKEVVTLAAIRSADNTTGSNHLEDSIRVLSEEVAALKTKWNNNRERNGSKICFRCNREGHTARQCRVSQCHSCNKFGHISKNCTKNFNGPVLRPAKF
jgi:hypothetical protein